MPSARDGGIPILLAEMVVGKIVAFSMKSIYNLCIHYGSASGDIQHPTMQTNRHSGTSPTKHPFLL